MKNMKIQIELQGCSLEIGHIGTAECIKTQIALERASASAADLGKRLADVFELIGEAAKEAGRQLGAFLLSAKSQKLCGDDG